MADLPEKCCGKCTFRAYLEPGPIDPAKPPVMVYCGLPPADPFTIIKGVDPASREPIPHTFMIRRAMEVGSRCGFFFAGDPGEFTFYDAMRPPQ